jgi:hypothetical protein
VRRPSTHALEALADKRESVVPRPAEEIVVDEAFLDDNTVADERQEKGDRND